MSALNVYTSGASPWAKSCEARLSALHNCAGSQRANPSMRMLYVRVEGGPPAETNELKTSSAAVSDSLWTKPLSHALATEAPPAPPMSSELCGLRTLESARSTLSLIRPASTALFRSMRTSALPCCVR